MSNNIPKKPISEKKFKPLREGLSSLYRNLSARPTSPTFTKERIAILTKVGLVPNHVAVKFYGKGNGFNAEKSTLGLFARNRGMRNNLVVKKSSEKSKNEETLEKQNLKKRLLYSTALNSLVREMGCILNEDMGVVPDSMWSRYDKLTDNPKFRQRSMEDVKFDAIGGRTPGPGSYLRVRSLNGEEVREMKVVDEEKKFLKKQNLLGTEKKKNVKCTFGSDRWGEKVSEKVTTPPKKNTTIKKGKEQINNIEYKPPLRILPNSPWEAQELESLNALYWTLGRCKHATNPDSFTDHVELYVYRHRVLYKQRSKKEVRARIVDMFKFNKFKEKDEARYWDDRIVEKRERGVKGLTLNMRAGVRSRGTSGSFDVGSTHPGKGNTTTITTINSNPSLNSTSNSNTSKRPLPKTPSSKTFTKPTFQSSHRARPLPPLPPKSPFATTLSSQYEGPSFTSSFITPNNGNGSRVRS